MSRVTKTKELLGLDKLGQRQQDRSLPITTPNNVKQRPRGGNTTTVAWNPTVTIPDPGTPAAVRLGTTITALDITEFTRITNTAPNTSQDGATTGIIAQLGVAATKTKCLIRLPAIEPTDLVSATLALWQNGTGNEPGEIVARWMSIANETWTEAGAAWNTRDGSAAWAGSAGLETPVTDYREELGRARVSDANTSRMLYIPLDVELVQYMMATGSGKSILLQFEENLGFDSKLNLGTDDNANNLIKPRVMVEHRADTATHLYALAITKNTWGVQLYATGIGATYRVGGGDATASDAPIPAGLPIVIELLDISKQISIYRPSGVVCYAEALGQV